MVPTRFNANNGYSFCSKSLSVSKLKVDIVVKAPSIPIVRKILWSADIRVLYSDRYMISPRMRLPARLTVSVPAGNRLDAF